MSQLRKSGGAHEGRRRQGDRARRAARRPGTRSARQAAGGRARDPRRTRRRRRFGHPRLAPTRTPARRSSRPTSCTREADVVLRVAKPSAAEVRRAARGPGGRRLPPAAHRSAAREGAGRRRASRRSASTRSRGRCRAPRRWTRCQSQANVGGYKAVLIAANAYGRYFPLLTTAAGTAKPANVLILGHRRRRAPGDRHGQAPRRGRQGLRRPTRDARAGRVARRPVRQAQDDHRCDRRRRLRPRADRPRSGPPSRPSSTRSSAAWTSSSPRPRSRAASRRVLVTADAVAKMKLGLGHRRHGRLGARRQLRAERRPARRSRRPTA